jgi:hypothetical protein
MKKLILSVVVAAFAVAVQAGDGACSEGGCCAAKQASTEAKAECPMAAKQAKQTKLASKSKAGKQTVKQQLKSPKAVAESRG